MRTTHKQLMLRALVLAVGIAVLTAACGSDKTNKTATAAKASAPPNAAAESAYCDTAREWSVHELVPTDDHDPVATKNWFGEYVAFNQKASGLAPAELKDEWTMNVEAITTQLLPVVEKYDYNIERLTSEGSDAEKALLDQPPENIQQAQAAIHRYESDVCASEQPPAAEVDFSKEKKATAYCDAISANNEANAKLFAGGAKPADVRDELNSKEWKGIIEKEYTAAPNALKADRDVLHDYWVNKQVPLMAKYGYDFRKILLDGTQADRETLQSTAPEVRDHYARAAAYEEQVCGSE